MGEDGRVGWWANEDQKGTGLASGGGPYPNPPPKQAALHGLLRSASAIRMAGALVRVRRHVPLL